MTTPRTPRTPRTEAGRAPVTADDLDDVLRLAVATLRDAPPERWDEKAGELEWDCWETAEHLVTDLFVYATQLGSRGSTADVYLPFLRESRRPNGPVNAVHADRTAGADGLLRILATCGALLSAVVRTTPPDVRAHHVYGASDAEGFAAMGVVETAVHLHGLAAGLGLAWEPPAEVCARALARLFPDAPAGVDPWSALLWSTGRVDLPGRHRLASWRWDGTPRAPRRQGRPEAARRTDVGSPNPPSPCRACTW